LQNVEREISAGKSTTAQFASEVRHNLGICGVNVVVIFVVVVVAVVLVVMVPGDVIVQAVRPSHLKYCFQPTIGRQLL
jgi:hypothetical protein